MAFKVNYTAFCLAEDKTILMRGSVQTGRAGVRHEPTETTPLQCRIMELIRLHCSRRNAFLFGHSLELALLEARQLSSRLKTIEYQVSIHSNYNYIH